MGIDGSEVDVGVVILGWVGVRVGSLIRTCSYCSVSCCLHSRQELLTGRMEHWQQSILCKDYKKLPNC